MNKLELIETLKTETGLTKNEATAVVNLFFDEMAKVRFDEIFILSNLFFGKIFD